MRDTVASPYGDLARPDLLPQPACRVTLVCGPPAAGKSTYVRHRITSSDSLNDFDEIAREHGYARERPPEAIPILLAERNERLAQLASAPSDHHAWVIITAPGERLRHWWRDMLNAELVLIMPPKKELFERIRQDPERRKVIQHQMRLVGQWFAKERENNPGRILPGCDESGWPLDKLHPWRQELS